MQYVQNLNGIADDPVEDQIVAVDLSTNTVAVAMFDELIGRRSRTNLETGVTQFPH
jgi:hypothetical protein